MFCSSLSGVYFSQSSPYPYPQDIFSSPMDSIDSQPPRKGITVAYVTRSTSTPFSLLFLLFLEELALGPSHLLACVNLGQHRIHLVGPRGSDVPNSPYTPSHARDRYSLEEHDDPHTPTARYNTSELNTSIVYRVLYEQTVHARTYVSLRSVKRPFCTSVETLMPRLNTRL